MRTEELIKALRKLKVHTGCFACLGCGHEHSCSVHGCAIINEAIATIATECGRWIDARVEVPDPDALKSDFVIGIANGRSSNGNVRYEDAIIMVEYDNGEWWPEEDPQADITVSHWMPLPKLPEEDEE